MRRLAVFLSALMFAFAMNGEALARTVKPKSDGDKQTMREKAEQHAADLRDKKNADKGAPLMHFRASSGHSKSDSNWLHERERKPY